MTLLLECTQKLIFESEAMRTIEEITKEILSLPSDSRALLAEKLLESLEFDPDSAIQAQWLSEAKRRREEVLSRTS